MKTSKFSDLRPADFSMSERLVVVRGENLNCARPLMLRFALRKAQDPRAVGGVARVRREHDRQPNFALPNRKDATEFFGFQPSGTLLQSNLPLGSGLAGSLVSPSDFPRP